MERALAGQDLKGGSQDDAGHARSSKSGAAAQEVQMGVPVAGPGQPPQAAAPGAAGHAATEAPGVVIRMDRPADAAPGVAGAAAKAGTASMAASPFAAAVLDLEGLVGRAGTALLPPGIDPALLNEATLRNLFRAQVRRGRGD